MVEFVSIVESSNGSRTYHINLTESNKIISDLMKTMLFGDETTKKNESFSKIYKELMRDIKKSLNSHYYKTS